MAERCKSSLQTLRDWLVRASEHGWDLADLSLSQYKEPIDQLCGLRRSLNDHEASIQADALAVNPVSLPEGGLALPLFDPSTSVNELGYPFSDLWDMFSWEESSHG